MILHFVDIGGIVEYHFISWSLQYSLVYFVFFVSFSFSAYSYIFVMFSIIYQRIIVDNDYIKFTETTTQQSECLAVMDHWINAFIIIVYTQNREAKVNNYRKMGNIPNVLML